VRSGRLPTAVAAAVAAILVGCPAAAAHGSGGKQTGFRATLAGIVPAVAGVSVLVRDYDDRLRLTNESGQVVVVEGYEGEPYLSFRPGRGVFRNASSSATYLNDDRYGTSAIPAGVGADAAPRWVRVSRERFYEWHDHRIHWMSPIPPPAVRQEPRAEHHVFDWTVPATRGATPFRIVGSLDYVPPAETRFPTLLIVPLAVLALLTAGVWRLRRRLERRSS
jgi:hypothetical protein